MSTRKKGKLQPNEQATIERAVVIDAAMPTRAVIASETPIDKWDEQTQQIVKEVLLMSGLTLRGGRDQVPIVDSHDDRSVRNIFGSIQQIRVDPAAGELIGVPVFASDEESQTIAQRMAEGHITDFSITAQPLETLYVGRGQTYTTERGVVIEGPALIHTRWQPHNASICATGADVNSTVRRAYSNLSQRIKRMDEALVSALSAMGLPEGMTDPNQVLAWVVGKLGSAQPAMAEVGEIESAVTATEPVTEEPKPPEEEIAMTNTATTTERTVDVQAEIKRALEADATRRKEIHAACALAKLERSFADDLSDRGASIHDARKAILEHIATQPLGTSSGVETVRVTRASEDKLYDAARDGLLMRAQQSAATKRSLIGEKAAEGADEFRNLPLSRISEVFVEKMGAPVRRMSPKDIALVAMGHPGTLNRYRIQREAYHTTGSFSNLMLDAANKTLQAGYEEARITYNLWARTAPSVADFKAINRIRFSESPNLEMVPQNHEYPEKTMSDDKESYKVEKFGAIFTVTWETIVNDDLDALSRVPAMHGNAARRTQNAQVYAVLSANANMSDGNALFSASHASGSNTSGAAAAPSVTTLNAAFLAMRSQKGLNSSVYIDVQPRFLIVPVNYEATAMEVLGSFSRPEVGGSAAGNANTLNIYGPGGSRSLVLVSDPVLDSASTTDWYIAADQASIDTVEICFLQGEESPVLENEWDFDVDAYKYKIRQTFGTKAIDWRGLYRNKA